MTSKSKFLAAAALTASMVAYAQTRLATPAPTRGAPAAAATPGAATGSADAVTPTTADAGTAMAGDGGTAMGRPASGVTVPTPEAVKQVWDYYYYKGKGGGPILADVRLCLEIGKAGPTKGDCVREMTVTDNFRGSQRLLLWQAYLMPQDEQTEVEVQARLAGAVVNSQKVKVKGSAVRQRTWTTVNLDRPGKWTVAFVHNGTELKTMEFEVGKK